MFTLSRASQIVLKRTLTIMLIASACDYFHLFLRMLTNARSDRLQREFRTIPTGFERLWPVSIEHRVGWCTMKNESVTIAIEDLWHALDALDEVPAAKESDWYRRLEASANQASQRVLLRADDAERH
jgi:hypothetical protein